MMNRSFVDSHANRWTRIDRRKARRSFDRGENVLIIPCNVDPSGPWACYAYPSNRWGDSFDEIADLYASANCTGEAGRYLAFYVTHGPDVRVRGPRFSSCGGLGHFTADTLDAWVNGYRLDRIEHAGTYATLAERLNSRDCTPANVGEIIHDVLDPVAVSLVGRVAW